MVPRIKNQTTVGLNGEVLWCVLCYAGIVAMTRRLSVTQNSSIAKTNAVDLEWKCY